MRTEEEIGARLRLARRELDTARRQAAAAWGPENRAAFAQLAAELSREVHALEWVLGDPPVCAPYLLGWTPPKRKLRQHRRRIAP